MEQYTLEQPLVLTHILSILKDQKCVQEMCNLKQVLSSKESQEIIGEVLDPIKKATLEYTSYCYKVHDCFEGSKELREKLEEIDDSMEGYTAYFNNMSIEKEMCTRDDFFKCMYELTQNHLDLLEDDKDIKYLLTKKLIEYIEPLADDIEAVRFYLELLD